MAIKGSLSEAALADVIQLLTFSLKSGCLSVTDGKDFGNIFIKDGKIIHATILNRKYRLGDSMVVKHVIDEETLSRALEIQKKAMTTKVEVDSKFTFADMVKTAYEDDYEAMLKKTRALDARFTN